MPELLARAYRSAFSGSLMLEPLDAQPSSVRFVRGAVVEVSGPGMSRELEVSALERLLPPDTLEFAGRHADEYGVTPLAAVERLALLPPESLRSARQSLTALGVEALCGLSGDVRYAFVAPPERSGGAGETAAEVEPLGLLTACFLVESQRERAARSIAGFEHAALVLDAEAARRLLPTLHGSVRAVLESLLLSPGSVQSLRDRALVLSEELVASVCALWITRVITVREVGSSTFPAVTPSVVPRAPGVVASIPPFTPAASSMPPPRRDSGTIRAAEPVSERSVESGPVVRGAKEYAMEARVEEAWMKAEADPSRAQQITPIVTKAVSVFPRNPRLRYYLARLHIQASRMDEAARELERVLELDPTDVEAESDLARLRSLPKR